MQGQECGGRAVQDVHAMHHQGPRHRHLALCLIHVLLPLCPPQYYDVTGQGTNDYPVTDLLQMMGRASRPLQDEQGM